MRIVGVAPEIAFGDEAEANHFDFRRNALSSMRCRVLPTEVPAAVAEWSAITKMPPGLSTAKNLRFISARSTGM